MDREACELSRLMRRIAETPPEFLDEPCLGKKHGRVAVSAVVGDLCRGYGVEVPTRALEAFETGTVKADRNRLRVSLVLCWLLAEPWFREANIGQAPLLPLLLQGSRELAENVAADQFVRDPERREELARFALAHLGFRPHGETRAQAEDRLSSLSAAERARVLRASREAEERARAVREALARKAAEESADKATRE